MSFPRYPQYKDSGVEWLGAVPRNWEVTPLKRVADFINGAAFKPSEWAESGIPIIRIENLNGGENFNHFSGSLDPRYIVEPGDLLFGWSGNRGTSFGPYIWSKEGKYALNQHIFRVVFDGLDSQWFFWSLVAVTSHVEDQAHGIIGMVHVTKGDLGAIKIPFPDKREQRLIAAFLDRETAKIDGLMAEQKKLIALLKEKRQAVIFHAVTKGLDPAMPMKDSAIDWLGKVPAHWDYGALNRISDRVVVGIAEAATHAYSETGVPILRATNIRASRIIGELLFLDPTFAGERGSKLIRAGDLVTVRTGNAGVTALIPPELDGCQCFTMLITTLDSASSAEFYCYWMNSLAAQRYFSLEGWGTAQVNISVPILKGLSVPIPPFSEQLEIVDFLNHETSNLDQLIDQAESAIDLLKERRTALISAAVTGQIDVRGLIKEEQEQAA